jgi:hypothetical protein
MAAESELLTDGPFQLRIEAKCAGLLTARNAYGKARALMRDFE